MRRSRSAQSARPATRSSPSRRSRPTFRAGPRGSASSRGERPTAGESEIGWAVVEELSVNAARLLEPIFHEHHGRNGRLSIQTDPRLHRDAKALADQAEYFSTLAPNIIVKLPATKAGIEAIEEVTFRGVSINATVSFTVAQVLRVAEAVERGLERREAAGLPTDSMGPVATLMGGRLDDWLKHVAARSKTARDPRRPGLGRCRGDEARPPDPHRARASARASSRPPSATISSCPSWSVATW